MAQISKGYSFGATETVTNTKLHTMVDGATITNIVDADVAAGAAIQSTKISGLTTGENVTGLQLTYLNSIASTAGQIPLTNIPVTSILQSMFPIGSIYTNANVSTNPATLLGFGTWTAFGAGRVLVGLNGSDTDFDVAEETGGTKTHTLTVDEIPSHRHNEHMAVNTTGELEGNDGWRSATQEYDSSYTSYVGGGGAHNNLQPYIVVYFWKRTA
jgi:hypothetical protein